MIESGIVLNDLDVMYIILSVILISFEIINTKDFFENKEYRK